jgi:hypothetical protein
VLKTTRRPCLKRKKSFAYEGPHHRLCPRCRAANRRDPDPAEVWPGAGIRDGHGSA